MSPTIGFFDAPTRPFGAHVPPHRAWTVGKTVEDVLETQGHLDNLKDQLLADLSLTPQNTTIGTGFGGNRTILALLLERGFEIYLAPQDQSEPYVIFEDPETKQINISVSASLSKFSAKPLREALDKYCAPLNLVAIDSEVARDVSFWANLKVHPNFKKDIEELVKLEKVIMDIIGRAEVPERPTNAYNGSAEEMIWVERLHEYDRELASKVLPEEKEFFDAILQSLVFSSMLVPISLKLGLDVILSRRLDLLPDMTLLFERNFNLLRSIEETK